MQFIEKQSPPDEFVKYKRKDGASYRDLSQNSIEVKTCLRTSLLEEQGYICCYCGINIRADESIIEHVKDQDHHPQLQLEYNNLACSCKGGQDKRNNNPLYPLFCDANKNNQEIFVSPLELNCNDRFVFDDAGNIFGLDEGAEKTISILNLDNVKLKNQRKNAIDAYRYLEDEDTNWSEELLLTESRSTDNSFLPFCFVTSNYIKKYRMQ